MEDNSVEIEDQIQKHRHLRDEERLRSTGKKYLMNLEPTLEGFKTRSNPF